MTGEEFIELRELGAAARREERHSFSLEVQAMRLADIWEHVDKPNPWKPGDLVKWRTGVNCAFAGDLALVIEVREPGLEVWTETKQMRSPQNAAPLNTRLLFLLGDNVVPTWAEHWMVEPYVAEPG